MVHHSAFLLLLLTCLTDFVCETEQGGTMPVTPYGPKNVTISGPDSIEVGVTVSFMCSAECTPPCRFTWTLYRKTMTGSVIDITVNRFIFTESISCQAENTITGKTVMVNETLSVSECHWCGC